MKPRKAQLMRRTALRRTEFKPGRSTRAAKRRAATEIPEAIRLAALERDDRCCQRCGISLIGRRYSLQHRDPRGAGGRVGAHTLANLVALCGTGTTGCHGHVESYRTEATADGWLVPNGVTPEEWPVYRRNQRWEQPGALWTPASPHPRQVEMGAAA